VGLEAAPIAFAGTSADTRAWEISKPLPHSRLELVLASDGEGCGVSFYREAGRRLAVGGIWWSVVLFPLGKTAKNAIFDYCLLWKSQAMLPFWDRSSPPERKRARWTSADYVVSDRTRNFCDSPTRSKVPSAFAKASAEQASWGGARGLLFEWGTLRIRWIRAVRKNAKAKPRSTHVQARRRQGSDL